MAATRTTPRGFVFAVLFSIGLMLTSPHAYGDPGNIYNGAEIDLSDAISALQVLSAMAPAGISPAGDVNGDARIGLQEVVYVLQVVAGLRADIGGDNAALSALTFCCGPLTPSFDPAVFSYTTTVENGISEITVTPTAADSNATIDVEGVVVASGDASAPIHVNVGLNTVDIVVTAENNVTTRTYTINVCRQQVDESSNAYLSDLSFSGSVLSPAFHPDTLQYTATVPADTPQITVTATSQASGACIMINGALATSGIPSSPIPLVDGENDPIIVQVAAEDSSTVKTYQIVVTRGDAPELNANALLTGLAVSAAPLNEPFFAGQMAYTALVSAETTFTTVTATVEDPDATVTVNGTKVGSGAASPAIALSEGDTTIPVVVTAADGIASRTYKITLTREAAGTSVNALLSSLSIAPGQLDTTFAPGILSYSAHVAYFVDQVTVMATAADEDATITVNGAPVASGQASTPIDLVPGDNTISVLVTAQDGVTTSTYLLTVSRHGATGTVSMTALVVDPPAAGGNEFETLTEAISHLSGNLAPGELGEVRIKTTRPMAVGSLTFDCDIIITIEEGASRTIVGPGTSPLAITANGSLDLAGLDFVNSAGFVINSGTGLAVVGSHFSAQTTIHVNSGISPLTGGDRLPLSAIRPFGAVSKDLKFSGNTIDAGLTINASADTQKELSIENTTAPSLGVNGAFTGSSYLNLKSNLVGDLSLNLNLKDETTANIEGHMNLNLANADIGMEGAAQLNLKSTRAAELAAHFHGVKGVVRLENTILMSGSMNVDLNDATFSGHGNSYTNLNVNLGYSSDLVRFGITESGGYAYKTFQINAPDAPANAEITIGFDNFKFNGEARYSLGGRATVQLTNNTVLGAEAYLQFTGSVADCTLTDLTGQGKLFVEATDPSIQFNLSATRVQLADDFISETATVNFTGFLDEVRIMKGIVRLFSDSDFTGGLQNADRTPLQTTDPAITIRNLTASTDDGRTPLMIKGFDSPVTIENCTLDGQVWSIGVMDVNGDVTIQNNPSLKGGIYLDADPDGAGNFINRQYTITNNTVSQSASGGACLATKAIGSVLAANNTMVATGFATHGVLVYGGRVTVRGGTVITPGPPGSQALGVTGSTGGQNGILTAESIETISGTVQTSKQGWVRLTDNTFSNAKVVDYKEGLTAYPRLLNDPVADNSGLDPEEDIIGSLIDWNDDTHHCPDYPPKCDQWDEEEKECGCGEDGVSPPSEPGI